ncbi:MAG TPA: DUF5666 domain-containing protein [Terriglobales bacterium]|nr:DUF5666 domain-containing protein [Terriglobales bacterium]
MQLPVKLANGFCTQWRYLTLAALAMLLAASIGCGGGGSSTMPPAVSPANASLMQVNIGDAPADRVVSFEATVGPTTLNSSSGSSVTVLSGTRRIEVSHLAETAEPLVLVNVPQDTYTSAKIVVSNPEVTFLNSTGTMTTLEPVLSQTITVTFGSPLMVSGSATVLHLDLNLANSLSFDAQGNVTGVSFGPSSFALSLSAIAPENQQSPENGEMEDVTGVVSLVSGASFTLNVGQGGTPLVFTTDANTRFDEGASLATLMNMIVKVEGTTKADGTLYAKEVEGMEDGHGADVDGLVTSVQGNPTSQLSVMAQDGSGSGVDNSHIGVTLTADVSQAQFRVDTSNVDTSGLGSLPSSTFPFDGATVHAGQRVQLASSGALSGTTITAASVSLRQQTLVGTVSALSGPAAPATFTLALPSDSAFSKLSGAAAINVFWQPGTDVHDLNSGLHNGDSVRVRGLVFFSSTGVNLIASRIGQ